MKEEAFGTSRLFVFDSRDEMGRAVAIDAAKDLREMLYSREELNVIFAAAPSQNETLRHLAEQPGIDWGKVNAFHMDDYVGFPVGDPRSFNAFLGKAIFDRLNFKTVNLLNGMADPETECRRYTNLLRRYPVDAVFMGIGENGHIAFNGPPVADFDDPALVKIVDLDISCRQQQVNDGCFSDLDSVPIRAITLTIPALVAAKKLYGVVPGERKAQALHDALRGPIAVSCPASILRRTPGVRIYTDVDAARLL